MAATVISLIGLLFALAILIVMCMKGVSVYISTVVVTLLLCITSRMPFLTTLTGTYMSGFGTYFTGYLITFCCGGFFGAFMEMTGGSKAVARKVVTLFGARWCVVGAIIAVALMTYGGLVGMAVIFAAYPIVIQVFREGNLPRRFVPAVMLFALGTFANCGPGSPQVLNVVATSNLGLDLMAGWQWGFFGFVATALSGTIYLLVEIKKDVNRGGHFVEAEHDMPADQNEKLPNGWISMIPLVLTIVILNVKINGTALNINAGLFVGAFSVLAVNFKYVKWREIVSAMTKTVTNMIGSVSIVSAVVAVGYVVKETFAFSYLTDVLASLSISPLFSLIIAVNIMAFTTGSATSAVSIMTPVLGPTYVGMGLDPNIVARIIAQASTGFDSVPHNGNIVFIINGLCHDTHKNCYKPVFITCVLCPIIGALVTAVVYMLIH